MTGNLNIPVTVNTIGTNAFAGCYGFTGSLTLPSVATLGTAAFQNCYGFTGPLTLPSTLTSMSHSVFEGCYGLSGTLTIPANITYLGHYVFRGCSGLTDANIYVVKSRIDSSIECFKDTGITTIHARASDATWTDGAGQTIGGKSGITVIKDL